MKEKVIVSWSGDKDSALALHHILNEDKYQIAALLTTITADYQRVSMHGVRQTLLEQQAHSLNLPLKEVFIPKDCTDQTYRHIMRAALQEFQSQGVDAVVSGDLFLEDVRAYREENLAEIGMRAIFPLWGSDTAKLAQQFIRLGYKAILVCVDTQTLPGDFSGRPYDQQLLQDLPSAIDPCGENGEFHTFVYDGPIFKQPIPLQKGELVLRQGRFMYCDLIPPMD